MGLTHVMCLHLCVYRVWVEWLLYGVTMTNSSVVFFHIASLLWFNEEGTSKNICHIFIINERYKFTKHAYTNYPMGYPMSQAHMGQAHMCPAPMPQENPPWFVWILWVILIKVLLPLCLCVCLCLCLCKVKSTQGEPTQSGRGHYKYLSICAFLSCVPPHYVYVYVYVYV